MRFKNFQIYRGSSEADRQRYLQGPLSNTLRDITIGLRRLDLDDNFHAFLESSLVIPSATEVSVTNQLTDYNGNKLLPTKWFVVDKTSSGTSDIVRGDTTWTLDTLYLKNTGAASATVSVLFMK